MNHFGNTEKNCRRWILLPTRLVVPATKNMLLAGFCRLPATKYLLCAGFCRLRRQNICCLLAFVCWIFVCWHDAGFCLLDLRLWFGKQKNVILKELLQLSFFRKKTGIFPEHNVPLVNLSSWWPYTKITTPNRSNFITVPINNCKFHRFSFYS